MSPQQLEGVRLDAEIGQPLSMQQSAEADASTWSAEWGVGSQREEPDWSLFDGSVLSPPPPLLMIAFIKALATFPNGSGLGWDAMHPKALLRLSIRVLEAVLVLLAMCEAEGRWPNIIELAIIALLLKPDGGYRPIGLLPGLARIWSRARRDAALTWEAANARPYLYAGMTKGATVAAWKQAFRAEHAAAPKVHYAQSLLDLVKAFERIPHYILVREVVALN